MLNDYHEA
jgi:hypothetical protein